MAYLLVFLIGLVAGAMGVLLLINPFQSDDHEI